MKNAVAASTVALTIWAAANQEKEERLEQELQKKEQRHQRKKSNDRIRATANRHMKSAWKMSSNDNNNNNKTSAMRPTSTAEFSTPDAPRLLEVLREKQQQSSEKRTKPRVLSTRFLELCCCLSRSSMVRSKGL